MRFRYVTPVVLAVATFFTAVPQAFAQAPTHSTTPTAMHEAVQTAHADAQAARQFLGEVIARPGIQQQFARVGVSSSALGARVAALSDSEVVQMQKQLMSKELQAAPAGRMDMMTAYIIGLGVGAVILLIVLVAAAGSTPYYYY